MATQISIDDCMPDSFLNRTRSYIDAEYTKMRDDGDLPSVKNNYEAYGQMAERLVSLAGNMKLVKSGVEDALKLIASEPATFQQSICDTYSAAINVAISAVFMAIMAQNVSMQSLERRRVVNLDDDGQLMLDGIEGDELPDDEEAEEGDEV